MVAQEIRIGNCIAKNRNRKIELYHGPTIRYADADWLEYVGRFLHSDPPTSFANFTPW
jgi:hypothetical protein